MLERFPLPLGAWDGLQYFIVALPEPSIEFFLFSTVTPMRRGRGYNKKQYTVLGTLSREEMLCGVVDVRDMSGNIATISQDARLELAGTLLQFIKCSIRS